jgi:hypothetical protein
VRPPVAPGGPWGAGLAVDVSYAPHMLHYSWRGPAPTADQLTTLRQQMAEAGHLTAWTGLLVDMRALTTLPSYADLRASITRDRADRMTARTIAFLVDTVAQYGVGRQWEMLLPSGVACAVFTDEATARAWLETPR